MTRSSSAWTTTPAARRRRVLERASVNTFGIFVLAPCRSCCWPCCWPTRSTGGCAARTFFRMGVLLPLVTSVAAVAIVFTQLFGRDYGMVNWLLGFFGVHPIDWQANKWSSWLAIATMVDWRWTGYNALIFLAAHAGDPASDLYEAAAHRRRVARGGSSGRSPCRCCARRSSSSSSSPPSAACSCSPSRCCSTPAHHRPAARCASPRPWRCTSFENAFRQLPLRLRLGGRLGAVPADPDLLAAQLPAHPPSRGRRMTAVTSRCAPAVAGTRRGSAGRPAGRRADLGVVLSAFPLYCMFVVATRTNEAVGAVPPPFLARAAPRRQRRGGCSTTSDAHFCTALVNSAIVSAAVTVSVVLFSTLAGFAFAKLRFRGATRCCWPSSPTMMVPAAARDHPAVHAHGAAAAGPAQLQAVIVPFLVTGFGVFMMRQYAAQAVPDELIEAARVDGASTLRIFWSVVLPALRPGRRRAGAVHVHADLERLPLAADSVLNPDNPTVQVSLAPLNQRLLQRLRADVRRHRARDRPAARRLRRSSAARSSAESWKVRSRHDDSSRSQTATRLTLPDRLPLGRGHRGVPDRGRGRPRTAAAPSIWDTFSHTPGGCCGGDTGDVASTTTTGTATTSR